MFFKQWGLVCMEYVLLKQGWCVCEIISVESMSLKRMTEILGVFGISVDTYRKVVIYWDLMGFICWETSTVCELENHHAINRKTHSFDWAIFNSYVTNYQRVA